MLVHVGIPCIDGKPCAATVDSLLAETVLGFGEGVHLLVDWVVGNSLIGCARNILAHRFLKMSLAQTFVMVDADISWKGGDLIKLAKRPEKVIGATYRIKQPEEKYHALGPIEREGELYRVRGLPGGFIKIDRSVFEEIPARYYECGVDAVHDFFPQGISGGGYTGEDYGFCRLWREAGGDVWLDPSIKLKHHDGLRFFTGDPSWWLEAQVRKANGESFRHCLNAIRRGEDTPQTYQELIVAWDNLSLWPASGEMLRQLADMARAAEGPILEFGSGLSTLVMRSVTDQPIVSYESDEVWAKKVQDAVADAGLAPVTIKVTPLVDEFYQVSEPDSSFALAVCDGPSDQDGRVHGFEAMHKALKDDGQFVVDDLHFTKLENGFRKWARDAGARFRVFDSKNDKLFAVGHL